MIGAKRRRIRSGRFEHGLHDGAGDGRGDPATGDLADAGLGLDDDRDGDLGRLAGRARRRR